MPNPKANPIPPLTQALIDRFWSKVDRSGGPNACWPWKGGKTPKGYGGFHIRRRKFRVNRIALFLTTGIDPGDLRALHSCDNPPCCNGAHLFPGTDADNTQDMYAKGRAPSGIVAPELIRRGEGQWNHKLTDGDVRLIRLRYLEGHRQHVIAQEFNIRQSLVSRIVNRQAWAHVS